MSERIPQRNEIPAEHKWSIEDLYATDAAWEQDLSKAKEFPAKIASYKGLLSTDSAKLLEYLKYDDDMTVILENMINYAQRKNDEDTREAKYQDMVSRLEMLFVDISGASAFVTPEILPSMTKPWSASIRSSPAWSFTACASTEYAAGRRISSPKQRSA